MAMQYALSYIAHRLVGWSPNMKMAINVRLLDSSKNAAGIIRADLGDLSNTQKGIWSQFTFKTKQAVLTDRSQSS